MDPKSINIAWIFFKSLELGFFLLFDETFRHSYKFQSFEVIIKLIMRLSHIFKTSLDSND